MELNDAVERKLLKHHALHVCVLTTMKARCYREVKGQPYARKEYIGGHPPPKITKFTMGNPSATFRYQLKLVATEAAQIRHNALEAARVAANRFLQEELGESNYCLRVLPYPHVVLRENKLIFGAHADRLQDGMSKAFGKPIGTAARVKPDQPILVVDVNEGSVEVAKEALARGKAKLPIPCKVVESSLD